jgi:hypothetical protein
MKKIASTLFLVSVFVFSLSTNAIAEEGNIGHGKTCPPNTTCLVDTQVPTTQTEDSTIIKTVLDYLAQLFG